MNGQHHSVCYNHCPYLSLPYLCSFLRHSSDNPDLLLHSSTFFSPSQTYCLLFLSLHIFSILLAACLSVLTLHTISHARQHLSLSPVCITHILIRLSPLQWPLSSLSLLCTCSESSGPVSLHIWLKFVCCQACQSLEFHDTSSSNPKWAGWVRADEIQFIGCHFCIFSFNSDRGSRDITPNEFMGNVVWMRIIHMWVNLC